MMKMIRRRRKGRKERNMRNKTIEKTEERGKKKSGQNNVYQFSPR